MKWTPTPFVSEKSDWAENLDFRGFQQFWDSTKISNFFADKFFFSSSQIFRTLFSLFSRKKSNIFSKSEKYWDFPYIKKSNFFELKNSIIITVYFFDANKIAISFPKPPENRDFLKFLYSVCRKNLEKICFFSQDFYIAFFEKNNQKIRFFHIFFRFFSKFFEKIALKKSHFCFFSSNFR